MTRLLTDGAEMGDARFWDYYRNVTTVTVPVPVGGEYSYRGAWLGAHKVLSAPINEFYLRYRMQASSITGMEGDRVLGWRSGNRLVAYCTTDSLGRLSAVVKSSSVGHSFNALSSNQWYLISVHYLQATIGGRFEVYIDGNQVIDYTGNTDPDLYGTINNIYWDTNAYVHTYIDDLALNDTNGVEDNSWCGDGMIYRMTPNGDGDVNNWVNEGDDSINNYSHVDEYPHDDDASYVDCESSLLTTRDEYNLTDLDITGMIVTRVYPEVRARKTSPDETAIRLGILPSGGSEDMSDNRILFVDDYARIVGNEYLLNPVDSDIWEQLDLNSLQMVIELG